MKSLRDSGGQIWGLQKSHNSSDWSLMFVHMKDKFKAQT